VSNYRCITLLCWGMLIMLPGYVHSADVTKGSKIYNRHCSHCHGQDGLSVLPNAPDLSQPRGIIRSDLRLKERVENGNRGCPSFKGIISERDILNLITYVRTLY